MTESPGKPFTVSVDKASAAEDRVAVVGLEGFLDAHTSGDFEEAVDAWLDNGYVLFVLDAGKLNYISSAGIGALMRLVQESRRREGDVVILTPPAKVYGVLELLGFTEILSFSESLESALGMLQG